jgi:hypothetical protein
MTTKTLGGEESWGNLAYYVEKTKKSPSREEKEGPFVFYNPCIWTI